MLRSNESGYAVVWRVSSSKSATEACRSDNSSKWLSLRVVWSAIHCDTKSVYSVIFLPHELPSTDNDNTTRQIESRTREIVINWNREKPSEHRSAGISVCSDSKSQPSSFVTSPVHWHDLLSSRYPSIYISIHLPTYPPITIIRYHNKRTPLTKRFKLIFRSQLDVRLPSLYIPIECMYV